MPTKPPSPPTPPTSLTPATPERLREQDIQTMLEILLELRPLADLLARPLDEPGVGMVVRLHAILVAVEERLKATASQSLDLQAWKSDTDARLAAIERGQDEQLSLLEEIAAVLLEPVD